MLDDTKEQSLHSDTKNNALHKYKHGNSADVYAMRSHLCMSTEIEYLRKPLGITGSDDCDTLPRLQVMRYDQDGKISAMFTS